MSKLSGMLKSCRLFIEVVTTNATRKKVTDEDLKQQIVKIQQQITAIYAHPKLSGNQRISERCDSGRELLQDVYMELNTGAPALARKWMAAKLEEMAELFREMDQELQ